jgi:hypothetical protein
LDILRNLFGNLTSGVIRLAVTGGILFLCYLFIVRPVLKTTDEAIQRSGLDQVDSTIESVNRGVQRQIRHSLRVARARGGDTDRLIRCIERAQPDVRKIERCTRRF